jgi:uncharacterized protein YndB with AHSA1/START domain
MTDAAITERDLSIDPRRMWEHMTDPDRLGQWLGGDIELDRPDSVGLCPGDEGSIQFTGDEHPCVLLVEEVEDGERLAFRWASPTLPPTEVTIDLLPIPAGTRIRVVERVLPSGSASRHVATARAAAFA